MRAVRKAKETLGVGDGVSAGAGTGTEGGGVGTGTRGGGGARGGSLQRGGRGGGGPATGAAGLGKRTRDAGYGRAPFDAAAGAQRDGNESDSSTRSSVRGIPMPRDTPPPIPPAFLQNQPHPHRRRNGGNGGGGRGASTNPNLEPVDPARRRMQHPLPSRPGIHEEGVLQAQTQSPPPAVAAVTVYESKPMVRDLRKEAVSKFVPSAVRQKMGALKGQMGKLLEPEEVERLEGEGYTVGMGAGTGNGKKGGGVGLGTGAGGGAGVKVDPGAGSMTLEEEERRFEAELRDVDGMEMEVEDQGEDG